MAPRSGTPQHGKSCRAVDMLSLSLLVAARAIGPPSSYEPSADPAAIVLCDATLRLTVLTRKIVRAETVPHPGDGFEDRATITVVNRRLPVPHFTVKNTSTWCNISIFGGIDVAVRKDIPAPLPPPLAPSSCTSTRPGFDAVCQGACSRAGPVLQKQTEASCCAACNKNEHCGSWVFNSGRGPAEGDCFLLTHGTVVKTKPGTGKTAGGEMGAGPGPNPVNRLRSPGVLQAYDGPAGWSWQAWVPEKSNLLGTLRPTPSADLGGCCSNPDASKGKYDPHDPYVLQSGLLSRFGCTAVDDSTTPIYDIPAGDLDDAWLANTTEFPTVAGREDLYIFGCGQDYRGCLADFILIAGPMALPPISGLGVWWSRHWGSPDDIPWGGSYFGPMTEQNIMSKVVKPHESKNLPLHVLVMDMEWHETRSPCYKSGHGAWGGYKWNTSLFSDPAAWLSTMHSMRGPLGIKVAVNTHPDEGIDACQDNYVEMAKAIGEDSSQKKILTDLNQACGTEAKEPKTKCTRAYVDAYFKFMIEPIGADYQWTDSTDVTTFTNELYVRYPGSKKRKRTINLSRYGGLGQHRTPIGFSGDTERKWDTLTYQTYFTSRAANVAFGWWSHDIGGFRGSPVDEVFHTESPELNLRWLQFGQYAPIFRCHCRYCEQRIWTWGEEWFVMMRRPMVGRSNLVPYIYTHAVTRSYASGEALITPTYWDPAASASDEAYAPEYGRQYWFGRDMLVAPVTEAVHKATNTSSKSVWLPAGDWVSWGIPTSELSVRSIAHAMSAFSSVLGGRADAIRGPTVVSGEYGLNDIPVFVRAGAVIPTRTMGSAYRTMADPLVWMLATGASSGNGTVYEDDGESLDFKQGVGAITNLAYSMASAELDVRISASQGSFTGMAKNRAQWIVVHGMATLPESATCSGKALQHSAAGIAPGYWLARPDDKLVGDKGDDLELIVSAASLVIACESTPTTSGINIKMKQAAVEVHI